MKKIIFITLTIIAFINAQNSKPKIFNELESVITNGLDDSNKTLVNYIEYVANKNMDSINKYLLQPIKSKGRCKTPMLMLKRDHYIILLSYLKLLEKRRQIKQVVSYYIKAYRGIYNIKNDILIPVVYQIVISNKLGISLKQSIQAKVFTKNDAKKLYNSLSKAMILDNKPLIDSLENQKKCELNDYKKSLYIENNPFKAYKIFTDTFLNIVKKSYNSLIEAIKNNSLEKLKRKQELEKKLHNSLYTKYKMMLLKIKINLFNKLALKNSDPDYKKLAKYLAEELYKGPNLFATIKDYQNMVKENKKLLKQLKNIAQGKE